MMGLFSDERAVSEAIGYVIIFGMVITCIGIVLVSGDQVIKDTEARTSFQGVEQSFNVLASDLTKTALESSPVKTTRIKFDMGSLRLEPDDNMLVVKFPSGGAVPIYSGNYGSVRFESSRNDRAISLENGAIVEEYSISSIMSKPPRMYYSPDSKTLMITVIDLKGERAAVGNSALCSIQMKYSGSELIDISGPENTVEICVMTNATDAWKSYFTNDFTPVMTIQPSSDGWVNATLGNVKRVMIVRYDIDMKID
ncbi:hypothetical protein CUJ83_03900 [Methanocella sp. CWC-04]|uniref:Uncharacterized protein n=1 Tax=Methanooceanicella nereidis TaxID=2052831 RepID=A0AAP2RAT4_9EURY|nr:hypothetical protein [Methanocella sp. CWC-04]MCD1294136.1 hypothetical protein [Methanocella sp. CWC-04]